MNSEIVIKITAQGGGQSMETSLQGESGTVPVPDRNMGTSGGVGTASAGNLPSPSESFGAAGSSRHSEQAPSPEGSLSQMGASGGGGDLPKPVDPDEIENLGSKAKSGVNTEGAPVPEPE